MELDFPDNNEGGYAEVETGRNVRTTLEVVHGEYLRLGLESMMTHGRIALGVRLSPDEARRIGRYLIAQADISDEDRDDPREEGLARAYRENAKQRNDERSDSSEKGEDSS